MNDKKLLLVQTLVDAIPELTVGQLYWVHRVVDVFNMEYQYTISSSDLFDVTTIHNFGDAMRIHHSFSAEPFSKDKFEYVLVQVLRISGRQAHLALKGNPGHDAVIDGIRVSLKTQADRGINNNLLWVSKFMELGKGKWGDDPFELEELREQFLKHMKNYDRILSLRTLQKGPHWRYELVEIPKKTLELAQNGRLEMKLNSKQFPKPGYCFVFSDSGQKLFELYFDGGTERKLQIKNLKKELCRIHATWEFNIPQIL
jgi:hypothetical protein